MEAKKILIVNADDFGLHEAINEGIIIGLTKGIVTDLSIVPCGSAFEHGVSLLRPIGRTSVGVHLTLVGERPLNLPSEIPSLVTQNGRFFDSYVAFVRRYLLGKIKREDVSKELELQVKRVAETGLKITHLDTHQHLHLLPDVADVVIGLAKKMDIKYIRCPFVLEKMPFNLRGITLTFGKFFGRRLAYRLKKFGISFADYFWGMRAAGKLDKREILGILCGLPYGVSELVCHPAVDNESLGLVYPWRYKWREELDVLVSSDIKEFISKEGILLVDVESVVGR